MVLRYNHARLLSGLSPPWMYTQIRINERAFERADTILDFARG